MQGPVGGYEIVVSPYKDFALENEEFADRACQRLVRLMQEDRPFLGEALESFESAWADYVGTRFAVGTGCGTDAIKIALMAAGVGAGDDVLTPANTYIGTILGIIGAGARPVCVDPDPNTFLVGADLYESAITKKTRALVHVHLYGWVHEMAAIEQLTRDRGVLLVEDAAQAHGAGEEGRKAGAWGKAGCFSFHASKNLAAFGDGGMITTDDTKLARQARAIRDSGKVDHDRAEFLGCNSKLDTFQAAFLHLKLARLDKWNQRRSEVAEDYRKALPPRVQTPPEAHWPEHVYHQFVVKVDGRDDLREFLGQGSIETAIHYPIPPHLQKGLHQFGWSKGQFPVTEKLCGQILSLPIYPRLAPGNFDRICSRIAEWVASRKE